MDVSFMSCSFLSLALSQSWLSHMREWLSGGSFRFSAWEILTASWFQSI